MLAMLLEQLPSVSSWSLFQNFAGLFFTGGNLNLAFASKPHLSKASCIFERVFSIGLYDCSRDSSLSHSSQYFSVFSPTKGVCRSEKKRKRFLSLTEM